jgi:TfoX/Sxy family transcriptional regulator of competence genes
MPYNKKIEETIDSIIVTWPNVEKKRMFGGVCYLINGNICFGIINDFLIVRAGEEMAREKLREKHVRTFDITGKPMKGWFMVEEKGWKSLVDLNDWLTIGRDYAATLPEK